MHPRLEVARVDVPQRQTTGNFPAAIGQVDLRRTDRCGQNVMSFRRPHSRLAARELVHHVGAKPRVDAGQPDRMPPDPVLDQLVQPQPDLLLIRLAEQLAIPDQPRRHRPAERPHDPHQAVRLHVDTGHQCDSAGRHFPRGIARPQLRHRLPLRRLAALDPGLAERRIHPSPQHLRIRLRLGEGTRHRAERHPRRIQLGQVKPSHPVELGRRLPPTRLEHPQLVGVLDHRAAVRTDVMRFLRPAFRPAHMLPTQPILRPAMGTRHQEVPLIARQKRRLDPRRVLHRRRRPHQQFSIPERRRPLPRKADRIALRPGRRRIPIDLVAQHHPDRPGSQTRRTVRPGNRDVPPGKLLVQQRVPTVPRARVLDLPLQCRRVPHHRREPILRPGFRHLERRLNQQNRRRITIHVKPDNVPENLRPPDLRGLHHHDLSHRRIIDRIHDPALVRRTISPPPTRFGGAFGTQPPKLVGPLADCQPRRRP